MSASELLPYFQGMLPEAVDLLGELVASESHSGDKSAVDTLAAELAGHFNRRGAAASVLPAERSGNSLCAVWRSGSSTKPILVLGHIDTVWPSGTARARPFRVEKGRAFGPGIYDMKAGLLLSLLVAQALKEGLAKPDRDVVFLFTGDEETGTAGGLPHLRRHAAGCRAVLCLEPPLPGGLAKTSRKGVGVYRLSVQGISAHAGVEPEKGASAILELSRQVTLLDDWNDREAGTAITVGRIRGGTASNVVPAEAEAEIDVRVVNSEKGRAIEERMRCLRPYDNRCTLQLAGGMNRPPLERTLAVLDLYQRARLAALEMGWELGEGASGGGSDGSFTAAMGIPTLDGLGVEGDGAHAEHENIEIGNIPRRAALLCRLLETLD